MDYPYKTSFSAQIKPLVSEELDKYLAIASKQSAANFLPKGVDFNKRFDFLGFYGDAFTANKINLNDDGVGTEQAIQLAELYPFSLVDVNHTRSKCIGCVLSVTYTKFASNEILTLEEVKALKSPFTVVIGGIIWKLANPNIAELIEKSGDPNSELYGKIFLSWEIAFSKQNLIVLDKDKTNFEDGKIITDAKEIKELEGKLRANGGTGKFDDNQRIGRIAIGDIIPLGVGVVASPAGHVRAIVPNIIEETAKASTGSIQNNEKIEKNISHSPKIVVNHNSNKSIMKIKSVSDITDETLKELKASAITDFIKEQVEDVSLKFAKDKEEKESAAKVAQEKHDALAKEHNQLKEQAQKIQAALDKIEKEVAERAKQEQFNNRMASLDNEYDLTKEDREIIANQIKDMSEESYTKYVKDFSVLAKEKNKAAKASALKAIEDAKSKEAKASTDDTKVLDDALDKAKKEVKADLPNTQKTSETLLEKYASAFTYDQFEIKL